MDVLDGSSLCFPELLNASCRKPASGPPGAVLLNTVLAVVSLSTAVLNLLIIISVSHFRQLHTPTNTLLLSLAFSDFLVGLLSMPAEILKKSSCWFLGDAVCLLYNYVSYIITSASIGDMVLISVDRYVAICYPLRYPGLVTVARVRLCVCACWLCSLFHSTFILKDDLILPGRHHLCVGECVIVIDYIAGTVDLALTFAAPIATIVLLYTRVFVVAVSQVRAMRSQVATVSVRLSVSLTANKSELKAAGTLGVLVVVFLMCFCPYYCVFLVGSEALIVASEFYLLCLFYANSCLNPLIYALFYPWFRKAVKLILTLQILQPSSCDVNML